MKMPGSLMSIRVHQFIINIKVLLGPRRPIRLEAYTASEHIRLYKQTVQASCNLLTLHVLTIPRQACATPSPFCPCTGAYPYPKCCS